MSKFYLEYDGTRIDLNGTNGILLSEPTGFGIAMDTDFATICDGFFYPADRRQSIGRIVGDLVFLSDAYTKYKNFVDAVTTARKLVFVYEPLSTEYKADVSISHITKNETVGGMYKVEIGFDLKSLWYTESTLTGTGSVSVSAGGQYDTAVKVVVTSTLTNPVLTIESNSVEIAKASITHTTTGSFEYSNFPDDSHITDGGTDILGDTDITNNIFGRTRAAFTVNLSGAAMTVTVRKYWRTV